MKILHIACVAPPETGGIGQSANEMVKRLRERGEEATLVAPVMRGKTDEHHAPWIQRRPAPLRFGNASIMTGVKRLIRNHDVVHLHYPFFGTAEAVAQDCLMMKRPLVMTFHMDATAGGWLGAVFNTYRSVAQPAILRAAKKIFVSSFDYADASSIGGFHQAHPDRVIELPFGVDHDRFSPGVKGEFGIPEGARVVGFVGGMDAAHAFKGLPFLLKAIAMLPSDVHALLVGDGPQRLSFERQARDLGIIDRCHFAGRLPQERLPEAYRAMDVFSFASTSKAEAFGLVALEAMACGVPVVASNLPGVRSVVADNVTGLHIPHSDANALAEGLRRILDNPSLREGMSRAARERVISRYDWNRHVDELMKVYQDVIR
jgi:glycosyltransferase involved in cell wall biosynthesis